MFEFVTTRFEHVAAVCDRKVSVYGCNIRACGHKVDSGQFTVGHFSVDEPKEYLWDCLRKSLFFLYIRKDERSEECIRGEFPIHNLSLEHDF